MPSRLFFLIIFLALLCPFAFAVGLGVNPAFLEFSIRTEKDLEQFLFVINTENQTLDFNVYAADDWFLIEPNYFLLNAGQNQKVSVKLLPSAVFPEAKTQVMVVAGEPGQSQLKTGIKVPVKIVQFEQIRPNAQTDSNVSNQTLANGLTGFFGLNSQSLLFGILIIGLCALAVGLAKTKELKRKKSLK